MSVEKQHVPIERMDFFQDFESVAGWCWSQVETWSIHHQSTVGRQLVRAADSIGANLVEGDGRYSIADSINFFVMARASARDAKLWLERAIERNLIDEIEAAQQVELLTSATKRLNLFISSRRARSKSMVVKELPAEYRDDSPFAELT